MAGTDCRTGDSQAGATLVAPPPGRRPRPPSDPAASKEPISWLAAVLASVTVRTPSYRHAWHDRSEVVRLGRAFGGRCARSSSHVLRAKAAEMGQRQLTHRVSKIASFQESVKLSNSGRFQRFSPLEP